MSRPRTSLSIAAVLLLSACVPMARPDPTPSPIPPGTSPREAILGRPPADGDCFVTAYELVRVPDNLTLERHVVTAIRRPAWLPYGGFLGTPDQLAHALHGLVIQADPQAAWILVPGDPGPHADRWFPLLARSGSRVWYRDGSLSLCA